MSAIHLRSYQETALTKCRKSLATNCRILLYSPTGSGKTEMAFRMITGALAKGRKVVFLAHRKELVRQASRRLTTARIPHGMLQAENSHSLDARVLVCSIDTIHRRGLPDDIRLIIIDEAHVVAGSVKYRKLLFRYNNVPVVGLSATPFSPGLGKHYDQLGGPLFEELVVATSIRELIDLGFLVDIDVYAPASPDLTGVKTQRRIGGEIDYDEIDLARVVDQPHLIGDIWDHIERLAPGKQTIIFATSIAHSQHIVAVGEARGVKAAHLDYHADDEERAAVLDAFDRGEIQVLSNVALLAEGWDCPRTECMVLARPTKSQIRYIQMVGRILRPFPGKERALLLDHSGTVLRLGFPTDDLPLELDDGLPNQAGKQRPKPPSEPKACPKCKFVRPAGVHICPTCGFAPVRQSDVRVEDGELVKIVRKPPLSKAPKQHVYSQLLFIERQRHHNRGWSAHQYKSIFGVWPSGLEDVTAAPTQEVLNKVRANQIAYAKRKEKDHGTGY
jgi:DNA repair protein RadD